MGSSTVLEKSKSLSSMMVLEPRESKVKRANSAPPRPVGDSWRTRLWDNMYGESANILGNSDSPTSLGKTSSRLGEQVKEALHNGQSLHSLRKVVVQLLEPQLLVLKQQLPVASVAAAVVTTASFVHPKKDKVGPLTNLARLRLRGLMRKALTLSQRPRLTPSVRPSDSSLLLGKDTQAATQQQANSRRRLWSKR